MRKLFSLAVLIFFLAGSVAAADYDEELTEQQKDTVKEKFNSNANQTPSLLFVSVKDRTVNVELGSGEYGVVMDGKQIDEISNTAYSSAEVRVKVSSSTVDEVRNSSDPVDAVRQAKKNGDIQLQYVGGRDSVDSGNSSSDVATQDSENGSQGESSDREKSGPISSVTSAVGSTVDNLVGRVQVAATNFVLSL